MWKWLGLCVAVVCLPACEVYVEGGGTSVGVGSSEVAGNGDKLTETRTLGNFTRVENRTAMEVIVREAPDSAVDVTLDSNLQHLVDTHVQGDVLVIERNSPFSFRGEGRVVVRTPRLTGARVVSSGTLTVEGVTRVEDLDFAVTGSGALRFCGPARTLSAALEGSGSVRVCTPEELALDAVHLSLSGSGSLEYVGRARLVDTFSDASGSLAASGVAVRFVARARASGDIDGSGLRASEADLTVEASGGVRATVDGGKVNVSIQGSGDVDLWGDAQLWVSDSGSGELVRH